MDATTSDEEEQEQGQEQEQEPAPRYATNLCLAFEVWFLVCLAFTLPFVILDVAANGNDVWGALDLSEDERLTGEHAHWCEAVHPERFVRTPFNSYSALAFSYLGLLILVLVYVYDAWPALNHFRAYVIFNWLFAFALVFGGIGSFLNHASVVGGWADMIDRVSIWPLVTLPAFFFAMRLVPLPAERWAYNVAALVLVVVLLLLALPHILEVNGHTSDAIDAYLHYGVPSMALVFVSLLVARLIAETCGAYPRSASSIGLIVLSITLAVIAYTLQAPERLGICDPHGVWFLNTHLWWHVFQAISVFLVWLWCYFEDVADEEYMARANALREQRQPRLRLLPDLGRLWLLQPARPVPMPMPSEHAHMASRQVGRLTLQQRS